MYNPLDFLPIVRRAFAIIRPSRIVLVEAEVWPNLAAEAHRRRIPLALVNARLSARSERRFRRVRALVAPTFRCLDLVCAQEPQDIARWEALGVPRDRIREVGSIKYDPDGNARHPGVRRSSSPADSAIDRQPPHPARRQHASRRGGDPRQRPARAASPSSRTSALIIAPRHVERAREFIRAARGAGLARAHRSEAILHARATPDCLLLDTTGELRHWYARRDRCLHGQKPDGEWRAKPGRADHRRQAGRLRSAHGELRPPRGVRCWNQMPRSGERCRFAGVARSLELLGDNPTRARALCKMRNVSSRRIAVPRNGPPSWSLGSNRT